MNQLESRISSVQLGFYVHHWLETVLAKFWETVFPPQTIFFLCILFVSN